MLINLNNPAVSLAFGTTSTTISFSTDATPAAQTTTTGSANDTKFTVASASGLAKGDFLAVENGSLSGTTPWVAVINGPNGTLSAGSQLLTIPFPSTRSAVTNAVTNRYERIETRYHARKIVLTNTTTGDTYTWDQSLSMADNTANMVAGSNGAASTLTSNAILNRSNCIAIHPNLLLISCNFTLYCEYDYYS